MWVMSAMTGVVWAAPVNEPLLSADQLDKVRKDRDVRILDVRAPEDYQVAHIDGAVHLSVESLFVDDKGKKYIGPVQQIQSAFRAAGIDNASHVVVYDNGDFLVSARVFWVLEVYGHKRVSVLDGGFPAWSKAGKAISSRPVVPIASDYVPTVTPNRHATKLTTRLALNRPDVTIVDARNPPEYLGQQSHAARFGHIPNAVNLPAMEHFTVDGAVRRLKPVAELKQYYRDLDPSKKVITYCDTGVLSASTYFALRRLGYDVSNYDGSWLEWGNDTALPIVGPAGK